MHQRAFAKSPLSIDSAARPSYDRSSSYIVVDRNQIPAGGDFAEFQYSPTQDSRSRPTSPFRSPILSAKNTKFSTLTVNLFRKFVDLLCPYVLHKADGRASRNSHSKSKSAGDLAASDRASNTGGAQRGLEAARTTFRSTPNLVQAAMTSPRPQGGIFDDIFDVTPLDSPTHSDTDDFDIGPPTPPKDRIRFIEPAVTRSRFGVAADEIGSSSQRQIQMKARNRASSLSIPVDVSFDSVFGSDGGLLEEDGGLTVDMMLDMSI